jgi:hypothetical protein
VKVGMYGRFTSSKKNMTWLFDMQRSINCILDPCSVFDECTGQTASQRDQVLSAQAHSFFNQGKYFPAAQSYAQCSVTFEEVALKFLDVDERDALRSYLISRLERSRKTVGLKLIFDHYKIFTDLFGLCRTLRSE